MKKLSDKTKLYQAERKIDELKASCERLSNENADERRRVRNLEERLKIAQSEMSELDTKIRECGKDCMTLVRATNVLTKQILRETERNERARMRSGQDTVQLTPRSSANEGIR